MLGFLSDFPEHFDELAEWYWKEWGELKDQTLEQRKEQLSNRVNTERVDSTVVAVDEGGNLLGGAAVVHDDMSTRPDLTPWLASVYVSPEHRGRGVARALMDHILKVAKGMGHEKLHLWTEHSAAMYQHLGWAVEEQVQYLGRSVTIMSRQT
eukprot:gene5220-934_t